ncbi:MAG: hypothetical protein ACK5YK_00630, partial [Pseudomonadota bacterium]
MRFMRRLRIVAVMGLLALAAQSGHAQANWANVAFVSATMGVNANRLCVGEATRGDIGCPTYTPTVNSAGLLTAVNISTTGNISANRFIGDGSLLTGIGGGGGPTDRISSTNNQAMAVTTAGGTISFTLGGTAGAAYLHPSLGLVASGVSTTGPISATQVFAGNALQLASPTAVTACNASSAGTLRYNSSNTALELCTGSGWQPMGVGIPAGTISAFASTTCPLGWSEYTAARGRFLRGIDNSAGNDPDGTRSPGAVQGDALGSHRHHTTMGFDSNTFYGWQDGSGNPSAGDRVVAGTTRLIVASTQQFSQPVRLMRTEVNELPESGETRPKNVAVTYCQFNGTSNGWNNPLSGGSTTPGGSTGQVQYNTAGSLDASANFTWNNAASRLTATNISATNLTASGGATAGTLATGGLTVSGAT